MGGDGRAAEGEEDLLVAERVRRAGLAGGDRQAPEADLAGAAGRRGVAGGGDAVLDEGGPAEVLDVTKQAARQTVDHMQAAGLVVREADPADGRRKLLALTVSGRKVRAIALSVSADLEAEIGAQGARAVRRALLGMIEHHGDLAHVEARHSRAPWVSGPPQLAARHAMPATITAAATARRTGSPSRRTWAPSSEAMTIDASRPGATTLTGASVSATSTRM
jgi:hypothetical protein